jgi:hypothetical protein
MIRIVFAALASLVFITSAEAANKLYITEFAAFQNGGPQIAEVPRVASQTVDFSGGVASSSAFNSQTRYVRLLCDSRCSVRVTTAGTNATTSDMPMAADSPEYFKVYPGDKVSVIANP